MSKRECTVLDSALSPPLKVLEEWPGSMSNMAPASSFREQEQPIHGSEAMQSGRAADPSEERFMTPPERRSRRSSPEEGNEDSEKQGHGIHPLSYGVQQPAVSRALVFESLDSPDEDVTLLGSSADMAPHQHAPPASDEDDVMAPVNAGMEEDDDDVAIVEEAPRSRGQGRPGRSGQQRRAGHGADVGVFAEEGEEDARAGEGDLQSQEDADLALAKAMQEQVRMSTGQEKASSKSTDRCRSAAFHVQQCLQALCVPHKHDGGSRPTEMQFMLHVACTCGVCRSAHSCCSPSSSSTHTRPLRACHSQAAAAASA